MEKICLNNKKNINNHLIINSHSSDEKIPKFQILMNFFEPIKDFFIKVSMKRRQIVYLETEDSIYSYLIKNGVVRLSRTLMDGRRQIMDFGFPGDLLGYNYDVDQKYSIESITKVIIYKIPRKNLISYIKKDNNMIFFMHKLTVIDLEYSYNNIIRLKNQSALERIVTFLIEIQQRWALSYGKISNTVLLPMPRQDIADYLGLSFETVSRMINKLQNENHIFIIKNGIQIRDINFFNKYNLIFKY